LRNYYYEILKRIPAAKTKKISIGPRLLPIDPGPPQDEPPTASAADPP